MKLLRIVQKGGYYTKCLYVWTCIFDVLLMKQKNIFSWVCFYQVCSICTVHYFCQQQNLWVLSMASLLLKWYWYQRRIQNCKYCIREVSVTHFWNTSFQFCYISDGETSCYPIMPVVTTKQGGVVVTVNVYLESA